MTNRNRYQLTEPFDPKPFRRPRVGMVFALYVLILVLAIVGFSATTADAHGKWTRAMTIDIPNEPEDSTRKLGEALRELGATATCRGECLRYIDDYGRTLIVRFHP